MKKIILATVLTLGLGTGFVYAEETPKAAQELEHANKTATGAESVSGDMSKMKAAGKCGADQSGKMKTKVPSSTKKSTKSELELEHANKSATGSESVDGDMKAMKAQGKCSTGK